MMTEHEILMENYEDAFLRLLMENAARIEGEKLLPELGPAAVEQDALVDSMRRHYRRERLRRVGRAAFDLVRQTAVFVVLAALTFTTSLAASETVRTTAWFRGKAVSVPSFNLSRLSPTFEAAWLPWGFELKFSDDSPTQYRRYYANLSGSFIDATCLYLDDIRISPDLSAREVDVNGRAGFLQTTDSGLQLIIPVEDQGCLFLLVSSGVSEEDFLRTAKLFTCPW